MDKHNNLSVKDIEAARKATTEYFNSDELAANTWVEKYALRDNNHLYESTPDDMHKRLAREFARIEANYKNPMSEQEIYELFKDFKYIIPQGSPMSGIGNDFQIVSLSNCFVIGNQGESDSYGGILKIDQEQVQLMKRRGGVGHDLSHIRPKDTPVKNSALSSTGIVPFMERYSNTTNEVAQGGRRGALMLSISIKHPDVESFIDAKMTPFKITGANVSVKIDDEFMRCVISGKPYVQQFPINSKVPKFKKEIDARKLWNKIIHNAWAAAEPGVLFWDTIIRESLPDCYDSFGFRTISTNPCGEIPLCAYDSCRLLAVNLFSYVSNPFTKEAKFDFELFKNHIEKGQKLMDDLIDLELEKIERILDKIDADPENEDVKQVEKNLWLNIKMKCLEGRRTGFGITAEGDMIAAMGLRYGSQEANDFAVEVHKTLACAAYRSSVDMAKDRGAFPIFNAALEAKNPFIARLKEADGALYDDMIKYGRRNIALLTIAPTGSVSICTQTTSGIEPAFNIFYRRKRKINPDETNTKISHTDDEGKTWIEYVVVHHKFVLWAKINGYDLEGKTDEEINQIIEKSPYYKATADCIDWVSKVKMQGAIQKWVDHSISVTVNLPKETSEQVVKEIYQTAWECGCKGMTIYRDGSRDGVLTNGSSDSKKDESKVSDFKENNAPKRPTKLEADVIRFNNGSEKWVAFVGIFEGRPYEVFSGKANAFPALADSVQKGWIMRVKEKDRAARYDFQYKDDDGYNVTFEGLSRLFKKEYWNYAKLISGILRHGMPISNVIDLISKLNLDTDTINTWKNGVARALKNYVKDGTEVRGEQCPECGEKLTFTNGCKQCDACGWSKCG